MSAFRSARDLPAWRGLTPKPYSSGGKERLGRSRRWEIDISDGCSTSGHGGDLDPQTHRSRQGLAGAHAGEEAAQGRGHRIDQPHGATGLGNAENRRSLADGLRAGNPGPIAA
ncbi:transposase [Cereibacter sphaeroides]|uniref:transposase n=1 Tax=Cereibacter sphaeroides TaxID=1063 RepID=UPI003AF0E7F2